MTPSRRRTKVLVAGASGVIGYAAVKHFLSEPGCDVVVCRTLWPAVADALGMEPGDDRETSLASALSARACDWAAVVDRYGLRAPRALDAMVGQSAVYADVLLGVGRTATPMPQLVSTIKLRQAGFAECLDSEDDLAQWFHRLQARRLLPPPEGVAR